MRTDNSISTDNLAVSQQPIRQTAVPSLSVFKEGETDMTDIIQTVPRMLTIRELSEATGISQYAIRLLVKTNQITYFKSGAKYLVNYDRFIDYLNGKNN